MERRGIGTTPMLPAASIGTGVSTWHLPEGLGGASPPLRPNVIDPYGWRYRWWQNFLVVLVAYTAWASPFELAMERAASRPRLVADLVVDVFFGIDIAVSFFVAYLDKSTFLLVDDRSKIATRYLTRPWFVMDVASTIPVQIIYQLARGGKSNGPCGFLILLRLWRLRRASKLFARLEKDIRFSYLWTRFVKLLCVLMFVVHCAACLYLWLAFHYRVPEQTWIGSLSRDFKDRSVWFGYTYSVYWAMATLATVGYGDLHAANTGEMLFTVLFMVCNVFLMSYIIGNMTNLTAHGNTTTFRMRDMVDRVERFGNVNRLPTKMREQIMARVQLRFETSVQLQEEVLSQLPKAVRSDIEQHLFKAAVQSCYLFRGVSNSLIVELVSEMKAEYFPPKMDIVLENETPTDCYIIVSGQVEAWTTAKDGTENFVMKIGPRGMAGEIGVMYNIPQPFTIRSKTLAHVIRISRSHLMNIVRPNTADGDTVFSNFVQVQAEDVAFASWDHILNANPDRNDIKLRGDPIRVVIHEEIPSKSTRAGKLVCLPGSLQELMRLGEEKFGKAARWVLTAEGAEVEDIRAVRDGDHLFFSCLEETVLCLCSSRRMQACSCALINLPVPMYSFRV